MLTLAQWILRLTKGYIKYTGKKPDGLVKLKIKLEAAQRFKNQKPDPSKFLGWKPKVIKGGKEETGGITSIKTGKKDLTTEDVLKGPVTVEGPKGTRTWDLSKRAEEGEVIPMESPFTKDKFFRIKQGLSTKIK